MFRLWCLVIGCTAEGFGITYMWSKSTKQTRLTAKNPLKWSWCLMQASRSLTTSSPSRLVAWKPSLSGSLSGPADVQELTKWFRMSFNQLMNFKCVHTYSSFCSGCNSFAAGRSDESLLAELFTIGGRHTSLKFPVNAQVQLLPRLLLCQIIWGTHLILDSAFLATLIVPKGSFDFLSTISWSRSSRKITHFGIGCMAVSKPLLSHQACACTWYCL